MDGASHEGQRHPNRKKARASQANTDLDFTPTELPAWTLVQAAHLVGRRFHETFASQGLTAHQFGVLVALGRQPDQSQANLARSVLVTPQSMGEILIQMAAAGLIQRAPTKRGRVSSIDVTPAGYDKLNQTYPLVEAINSAEALGLDGTETRTLNELLRRVHDHLDNRPFKPLHDGV